MPPPSVRGHPTQVPSTTFVVLLLQRHAYVLSLELCQCHYTSTALVGRRNHKLRVLYKLRQISCQPGDHTIDVE
eukprot:4460697-Amphidinium_carterae.1